MSGEVRLVAWVRGDNEYHERGEATPDEIRAAVVPLLDYEAAARALRPYLAEDMPGWTAGWQDAVAKCAVNAALGLGEPTSQGGET